MSQVDYCSVKLEISGAYRGHCAQLINVNVLTARRRQLCLYIETPVSLFVNNLYRVAYDRSLAG
ncbi:hypothetical protein [Mythimna sequax nucleopolyhedrovirus]|nr:hypothetical protein [Mythimna sequax nucleopolyhedrovirus]